MTKELIQAKEFLLSNGKTCVVLKNGTFYSSEEKGIKPLIDFLKQDNDFFKNAVIADKVIGKAAALLMIFGGATEVFGQNISDLAAECFERFGVIYHFENRAPYIINRNKTGMCPMESRCKDITDPFEAYENLKDLRL